MHHRIECIDALLDHRLRDHQLAHEVDQLVDLLDRDADRRRFGAVRGGLLGLLLDGLLLFLDRLVGRRRILDAGRGADLFHRLEEAVATGVVRPARCVGADLVERLEETVALPFDRAGGRLARFRFRQRIEETVTQVVLDLVAFRLFAGGLLRCQHRQFRDRHLFRVQHERADGDDVVQAFMRGDDHRVALAVERRDDDVRQQAQFGGQRRDLAMRHLRQFETIAAPAAVIDRLVFRRPLERGRHMGDRGQRHVLRQVLQHHAHVADGILVHGRTEAVAVQLHLQRVLRRQERIHVLARERHLALADAVQQGLEDVRHLRHVGQAERPRAPLDGVRGPEDRIQILFVRRADIDGEQQPFHFSQQFLGLVKKDLEELAYIDGHGDTPSNKLREHMISRSPFSRLRSGAADRTA